MFAYIPWSFFGTPALAVFGSDLLSYLNGKGEDAVGIYSVPSVDPCLFGGASLG